MNLPGNYFITAWVPPDLQDWIRREAIPRLPLQFPLPQGLSVEMPYRWHLTLRYLGGVNAECMSCIHDSLAEIVPQTSPVTLNLDMIDCFKRGRIGWFGPRDPATVLDGWVSRLNQRLSNCGFRIENHAFRPHITLVRSPHPWSCQRLALPSVSWTLTQIDLVRSLHGQYRSEASWTL